MNKTVLALTSALLLAGSAASTASAQDVIYYADDPVYAYGNGDVDGDGIPNSYDRYDDRYDQYGNLVRYDVGAYLPLGYFGSQTYVNERLYGLTPAPYGYRWTRLGNNVYLVSTRDGLIADVIYGLFGR
jgi:Ni/Co efflux regulator RcnB